MLLIHVEYRSPRVHYVIRQVFERVLRLPFRIVASAEEFRSAAGPRLSYGTQVFEGAIHVPWSGAIEQVPLSDPELGWHNGQQALFPVGVGHDLFAGMFFLLSLADELRSTDYDEHGRVRSSSLFSVRKGLADRPWVDEQAIRLGQHIERTWPGTWGGRSPYRHVVTVDMDNIQRYAGRPLHRAFGATVKDLARGEFDAVVERWLVRSGRKEDPFFNAMMRLEATGALVDRSILFCLVAGQGAHDHAASIDHPASKVMLRRMAQHVEMGLHPSYLSSEKEGLVNDERGRLQRAWGGPINLTRQHFLRWRLPNTLRYLADLGFTEEHSLGFTDRAGFRVSTCTPFPWYDLQAEEETSLMLWPFAAMDSALIEQMGQSPAEVVRSMCAMSDAVRSVQGTFVSVWHDRYLSGHREFAPWPAVFEQVVQYARA